METQITLSKVARVMKKPNLIHWANLLYALIFTASVLIAVRPGGSPTGEPLKRVDPAILMIVAQLGGVLLPAVLFIWLTRQPFSTALKLRRLSFGDGVKCLLVGLFCWPVVILQSILSAILTTAINPEGSPVTDIVTGGGSPWVAFLGIVLVAPLFEELLFRGVLLGAYEKSTGLHSIWLVALLFGFYHFSLDNLLLPLVVGLIAGWLAYRTRSIWAGVLAHVGANLLAGLMILLNVLVASAGAEAAVESTATLAPDAIWLSVMLWVGVGLVLLVPVFFFLRSISRQYPAPEQPASRLSLKTTWSTIPILLGATAYFGYQLLTLIRQ